MTTYYVFDCGLKDGPAVPVWTKAGARAVALALTWMTGRFHDFHTSPSGL